MKAKLGAGVWDLLFCEECKHSWADQDVDYEWTDDPEPATTTARTATRSKLPGKSAARSFLPLTGRRPPISLSTRSPGFADLAPT